MIDENKKRTYIIRKLRTRGSMHQLNCEDDLCSLDIGNYIFMAVFDGCSSGKDSHFASTFHRILTELTAKTMLSLPLNEWETDYEMLKAIVLTVRKNLGDYINSFAFSPVENNEMLSTGIFSIFNKNTGKVNALICGDGVISIDGKIYCKHNDGDVVLYLSTVPYNKFEEYLNSDCLKILDEPVISTYSISTDGIDSFKNIYGVSVSNTARETFFDGTRFMSQEIMLQRTYNMFIKRASEKVMNQDDFTMARLIIQDEIEPLKEDKAEEPMLCSCHCCEEKENNDKEKNSNEEERG